jgi:ankyrin repeat protein/AAA+ superfamily predicted ATPase
MSLQFRSSRLKEKFKGEQACSRVGTAASSEKGEKIPKQVQDAIENIVHNEPKLVLTEESVLRCQGFDEIRGNIVKSLRQNRPLCGYYALFNATLLNQDRVVDERNFQQVAAEFKGFLSQKLVLALQQGYRLGEWLHAENIYQIMTEDERRSIVVIDPTALFFEEETPVTLDELCRRLGKNGDEHPAQVFADFLQKRLKRIVVVANIGAHWIAIQADRNAEDNVRLTVADSLGASWHNNSKRFEKTIVPFYRALTTPVAEWSAVFTPAWRRHINIDAEQRRAEEEFERRKIHDEVFLSYCHFGYVSPLNEKILEKATESALKKLLWLSPEQSMALHNLVMQLDSLMPDINHIKELLTNPNKDSLEECDSAAEKILTNKRIDFRRDINLIADLFFYNACHDNEILEGSLYLIAGLVTAIEKLYKSLEDYRIDKESRIKKSTELCSIIKMVNDLHAEITKNKLLDIIEASSLIADFPVIEESLSTVHCSCDGILERVYTSCFFCFLEESGHVYCLSSNERDRFKENTRENVFTDEQYRRALSSGGIPSSWWDKIDKWQRLCFEKTIKFLSEMSRQGASIAQPIQPAADKVQDKPQSQESTNQGDKTVDQAQREMSLHEAAERNCFEKIEQLSRKPQDINELCAGVAPLHVAVIHGCNEAIAELLRCGASPNVRSETRWTPLHYAVQKQNKDVVTTLLAPSYHVDINAHTGKKYWTVSDQEDYVSPLIVAVQTGNFDIVKQLIEHGAQINSSGILGGWYPVKSPLFLAAENGYTNIAELLLDHGALLCEETDKLTPLHIAVEKGHEAVVALFLSRLSIMSKHINSALSCAVKAYVNIINELAPLSITQLRDKQDCHARYSKFVRIAEMLLNHGAIIGASYTDVLGSDRYLSMADLLIKNAPKDYLTGYLKYAASSSESNVNIIRKLLTRGAQPPKVVPVIKYPLHYPLHEVSDAGEVDRFNACLQRDALQVNRADEHRITPLHYAASRGHLSIVDLLCQNLAITQSETDFKLVPLHCAAAAGHTAVIQALLKYDPKHKALAKANIYGLTPLHAAVLAGHIDAACALIDGGADLDTRSSRGHTPVQYASRRKDVQMCLDREYAIRSFVEEHTQASPVEDNKPMETEDVAAETGQSDAQASSSQAQVCSPDKAQSDETTQTLRPLDLKGMFKGLDIAGSFVRSLQQKRLNGSRTVCSGYYALYNALSFIDQKIAPRLDRTSFVKQLDQYMNCIWNLRKHGPCDNLSVSDLRYLINELYPDKPIVILDKHTLYLMIKGDISVEKAFADDVCAVKKWRDFTEGKSKTLTLIAGIDKQAGHWITMYLTRENDSVRVDIADSLHTIDQWIFKNSRMCSQILPFYLALIIPEDRWAGEFTDKLNSELFPEYIFSNEDIQGFVTDKNKANVLRVTLERFIAQIHNISESLQLLLCKQHLGQQISLSDKQLLYARLSRFSKCITETSYVIVASELLLVDRKPQERDKNEGSLIDVLSSLRDCLFNEFVSTLMRSCEALVNRDKDTVIDSYKELSAIVDILSKLAQGAYGAIEAIDRDEGILTNEELFDADMLSLDKGHLQSIIENAPSIIKSIIGHIKNKQVEQEVIRILFVGPPGNGKTTLAQAIAQECNRPCHFIRASAIGDTYQFSRERDLKKLFAYIRCNPNAVIVIDEIDAIKDRENEPNRTAEVLQSIIDACNKRYPNVVFIATTNDKKLVPPALLSRFSQTIIEIPEPNNELRLRMIQRCCRVLGEKHIQHKLSQNDMLAFATKTDHFSIRHIESMFRTAIIMATGSEDRQVSKPRLRAVLLRDSLQNCVVTVEILEQAYKATCESLKDERASKVKKAYKYLNEHGDKILTGLSTVFNMGMQIVQMYVHSVERKEDKDPFGLGKLGEWAGVQLKKVHLEKIGAYVSPALKKVGVALPKIAAFVSLIQDGLRFVR